MDKYLLPLIPDLFNTLDYTIVYTKLDLKKVYYLLYIIKGNENKITF